MKVSEYRASRGNQGGCGEGAQAGMRGPALLASREAPEHIAYGVGRTTPDRTAWQTVHVGPRGDAVTTRARPAPA